MYRYLLLRTQTKCWNRLTSPYFDTFLVLTTVQFSNFTDILSMQRDMCFYSAFYAVMANSNNLCKH